MILISLVCSMAIYGKLYIMSWCSHGFPIKLEQFTQEEVLTKINNRKAAGLDEIPPVVWKTRKFDDILLRCCNAAYNQSTIDRWAKCCFFPFSKKGNIRITKTYRSITFTSNASKTYNDLLLNLIEPKIEKILKKNQNGFRRNRSTTSQILTIRRISEENSIAKIN